MADKSSSYWNNRSPYGDDDDPDEDDRSYGKKSTSPFYDDEDDDDDDASSSSYSGSSSYGGYGSSRSSNSYTSPSRSEPAITRDDVNQRRAQPVDPKREARPRPATGSSRFDRATGGGNKGGGLGGKLSGSLDALRKRLPGGGGQSRPKSGSSSGSGGSSSSSSYGSGSSSSYGSSSSSSSSSSKASSTRTVGLPGLGGLGRRDEKKSPTPAKPREKAAGGKSRFSISLPFGLGKKRDKPTGSASLRETPRPPSTPGSKRAKPLPASDRRPRLKNESMSLDRKLDLIGIGLMALAAIIFFGAISGNEGDVSGALLNIIYQLVGVGWFAVPVAIGGVGLWLILRHFGDRTPEADFAKIIGWVVLYLAGLTTAHFVRLLSETVYSVEQLRAISDEAWRVGQGGGWVGAQAYLFLVASIGDVGTFFALVGWWIVGLILATDLAVADIVAFFGRVFRRIRPPRQAGAAASAAQPALGTPAASEGLPASTVPALAESSLQRPALPQPETISLGMTVAVEREPIRISGRQVERAGASVPAVYADETNYEDDYEEAEEEAHPVPLQRGVVRLRRPAFEPEEDAAEIEPAAPEPMARLQAPEEDSEPEAIYPLRPPAAESQAALPSGTRPVVTEPDEAMISPASPAISRYEAPAPSAMSRQEASPVAPRQEMMPPADAKDASAKAGGPSLRERFFGGARLEPTPTPPMPVAEDEEEADEDYWEPPQPLTSSAPARPASSTPPRAAEPARSAPPAATPTPAIDPDFMKPAQPRDPNRVSVRAQTGRQPGAGLSPAERAALMGDFAGPPAEDADFEEEAAEVEEPVIYEPVDDVSYGPDDDEPAIEIDADEDDEDEEEDDFLPAKPPVTPAARPAPEIRPAATPAAVTPPRRDTGPLAAAPSPRNAPTSPAASEPAARPQPTIRHQADRKEMALSPSPSAISPIDGMPATAVSSSRYTWDLPDFTHILEPSTEQNINDDQLLDRARIIEDTLASFGAPGKVVEVNPGPVITQFGVEPDYIEGRGGKRIRVKVQAIARLADDLALALAARSIRIEAPVPGKGFVGIEVPNAEAAIVGLRDIMESREFKRIKGKLRIGLGQSVDGTPVAADLTAMPHLLIAGTTGSGKSVCVNAIIASLLLQNTPDDLRLIMVDPKRVELTGYNGIPHLVAPVVVELERIVGVLKWVMREMDERYKKFNQAGARNIADFNRRLPQGEKPMPYLVIFIDELADLMILAPDETERVLTRLAQMARATGIHLIISTQRPSVDIITGLIKANFPARIAFAVASSVDSRVILDQPGAERLLGRGDMLFQAPDAAAPLRMQGVFVSDNELTRMVHYWKGVRSADDKPAAGSLDASGVLTSSGLAPKPIPTIQGRTDKYGGPSARRERDLDEDFWDEGAPPRRESSTSDDDVDEMYDEAVEVVRSLKKASVSLLQRQLRIGYTRAARLIDIMEERGVIGGAQSGSKPRKVIGYSSDEDFEEEEE